MKQISSMMQMKFFTYPLYPKKRHIISIYFYTAKELISVFEKYVR